MVSLHKLISFCVLLFLIKLISSQQSYDDSSCTAESVQNSKYLCTPKDFPCHTYVVYRTQKDFQSMSSIAPLFNLSMSHLLEINHMTDADSSNLKLGREIIIPVQCSCALTFSKAIFMYHFSSTDSFASVACGVFQGLLKAQSLKEDNPDVKCNDPDDFMIKVPIRCACTNANQRRNGFKYLVTYPVIKNDNTDLIARKFGVPEETIWDANKLGPFSTIFPQTTLFIPTKDVPVVKWDVPEDLPSSPRVATPFVKIQPRTEDFNEGSMTGKALYKGPFCGSYVAIEQMNTEEAARHVIYILTKISHLNIVKLEGCCYGTNPYLVFEFAEYGSLRDCLSNANVARQLTWAKRTQIAFDLAVGLHYIHYCTKPSFIHHNIQSRNVLITTDWRAKITGFTLAKPVNSSEENGEISWNESVILGRKGYLAPEYLTYGLASLKLDVFAFGVVLLELLSAKEAAADGLFLKNPVISFEDAGHECSLGYLEKLKEFMDPVLEGKYPLVDAMCLAFLAKACVEQDPHHRPTMDNVIQALSRFV
ncbi:Kinase family protein / peptidoglycan-binding LysM domain-containing protein, putative [Theobroma cacao]|uniref:Kinase family protein / peptidoglycan-binding LysM domain-containing protein, putative n=1 Tax=Theobroma cacao TaxID=3641 RepID=A0A061G5H7_THECC|nr:Kinase family protein / peptidoglycan-binding LysM domain-containing protein, putative [Theobroma cacao]